MRKHSADTRIILEKSIARLLFLFFSIIILQRRRDSEKDIFDRFIQNSYKMSGFSRILKKTVFKTHIGRNGANLYISSVFLLKTHSFVAILKKPLKYAECHNCHISQWAIPILYRAYVTEK